FSRAFGRHAGVHAVAGRGHLMLRIRKRILLSSVATVSLLAGQSALAADKPLPVKAPALAPAPFWTGFYVGGHGGFSWGKLDGDTTHDVVVPAGVFPPFPFASPGVVPFPGIERDVKPRGGLGGVQAGYNFQSARVVYGIEADITWTGQRDTFNFSGRRDNFF